MAQHVPTDAANTSADLIEKAGHYNAACRLRELAQERDELVAYIQDDIAAVIDNAKALIETRVRAINGMATKEEFAEAFIALDKALVFLGRKP